MRNQAICLGLILALVMGVEAISWSGYVSTDSSRWDIYRQGANLSFDYSQAVEGVISPLDYHGRLISPYHSAYSEIVMNDVRLRERTGALEGSLRSEELMKLKSEAWKKVYRNTSKPAGSDVWLIEFEEVWPVTLNASRTLDYRGKNINDREFVGNQYDFAGASFLYNQELSKEQDVYLNLTRLNASVLATDEEILAVDYMPTRQMDYYLRSHSTGIADLRYQNSGFYEPASDLEEPQVIAEGFERYQGTYDIVRHISMNSNFTKLKNTPDWLPCCPGGYADMNPMETKNWGALGIFDCSCYRPPATAQFPR